MPDKLNNESKEDLSSEQIRESAAATLEEMTEIIIRGARMHNLKNVNLNIPRDKFVVITGLSGSGKSSLAFDTLYAEGQRRYVECLSPYAKQFLGMMKKPDVDVIEGLSPAISIEQKTISGNPRSTVGTVTEIYDYLRLLYAKIGTQYCVDCKVPVEQKNIDQIINEIFEEYKNKKIQILAPLVRARKGHYRELFEQLLKQGFTRVRVDAEIEEIKPGMQLSRYKIHDIELVVDRTIAEEKHQQRVYESCELAINRGEGSMMILYEEDGSWKERMYSTSYSCPSCGRAYDLLAPNMFSFNSPYGACPVCDGIGVIKDIDRQLLVDNPDKPITRNAIPVLTNKRQSWAMNQAKAFLRNNDIDPETPFKDIPEDIAALMLSGTEGKDIEISYQFSGGRELKYKQKYTGVIPSLRHQYENGSSGIKRTIEPYMASSVCHACKGGRLKSSSLAVLIDDNNIHDITSKDIERSLEHFKKLPKKLKKNEMAIANLILKEIVSRLQFLIDTGLAYLSLERPVKTLSGGESQRIRLASQIGSQLVGIMYILDEPSIGLHQHDNHKLINSLKKLRDLGNSVIVVEHDKAMIESADHVIDIGPGAGVHGGEIILAAEPKEFPSLNGDIAGRSLTLQYLTGNKSIEYPEKRRVGNGLILQLKGATGNNLKNVNLKVPLGRLICVTGMSGSGKSSLINDTLYPILSRHFHNSTEKPLPYKSIEGLENIDKVIEIDQAPIGRTPRSNPATYTGLFTLIRDFYSLLPEARVRGYKPGRFSFNVPGGRCEECEGAGLKKIEMNFLPEVYVQCDVCDGMRYNSETLSVKYKDRSIADVLNMTVEEAFDFFSEIPKIKKKLKTLMEVGLTYIKLGQQAPTLSGGEAQRVKLATELSKVTTGKTLYLLDEPTTGLHFEDIRILMKLIAKLVDKGNTAMIIEHNLDVIKFADWIIDLGPGGGESGGEIIAEGTPEQLIRKRKSFTAKYLKEELKN